MTLRSGETAQEDPLALYSRARDASTAGRNEEALRLILRAQRLLREVGRDWDARRVDLGRMHVLNEMGRHLVAVEVGRALLRAVAEDVPPAELAILPAAAHKNLGVSLGFLGDHGGALAAYEEAERRFVALGEDIEVAPLRNNQGIELLALGRAQEALELLADAVRRFEAEGDEVLAAESARHQAEALVALGRLRAAEELLDHVSAVFAEADLVPQLLRTRLVGAELSLALGQLDRAVARLEEVTTALATAGLLHDEAVALCRLGTAYGRLGLRSQAEGALDRAIAAATTMASTPLVAEAQLAMCDLAVELHDPESARQALDRALTRLRGGGWPALELHATLLGAALALAASHGAAGQNGAVGMWLARAREVAPEVDRADLILRHRHLEARAAWASGDRNRAIELVQQAAALARQPSAALSEPMARLSVMEDKVRISDDLATWLSDPRVSRPRAAVAVIEARKASVLREQIISALPGDAGGTVLDAAATAHQPAVSLSMHVHDGTMRVFLNRDGDVSSVHETPMDALPRLIRQLHAQLNRQRAGGTFARQHAERLAATTRSLLDGIAGELLGGALEELGDDVRVVVSPDGIIHEVPLCALRDARGPLVERMVLSTTPGLSGSGDEVVQPVLQPRLADALIVGVADRHAPAVEAEVTALGARIAGVRTLAGDDATVEAVRAASPGSSVLHLAGHARYEPGAPMRSAIKLADRWLTAAELATWPLAGSIVVMSACGTARTAALGGERLGLTRAALAAGAAAVVVAKWDIPDSGTMELLADVYDGLLDGEDLALALAGAQRRALAHDIHPYRWAAFEVVQQPSVVTSEQETRS